MSLEKALAAFVAASRAYCRAHEDKRTGDVVLLRHKLYDAYHGLRDEEERASAHAEGKAPK